MTRDSAIAWLRSAGRDARARDWSYGETIVIPYGERIAIRDPEDDEESGAWTGAAHLYPGHDGRWHLLDHGLPDPAETYADLASACRGVLDYIARRERALRPG